MPAQNWQNHIMDERSAHYDTVICGKKLILLQSTEIMKNNGMKGQIVPTKRFSKLHSELIPLLAVPGTEILLC